MVINKQELLDKVREVRNVAEVKNEISNELDFVIGELENEVGKISDGVEFADIQERLSVLSNGYLSKEFIVYGWFFSSILSFVLLVFWIILKTLVNCPPPKRGGGFSILHSTYWHCSLKARSEPFCSF